MGLLIVGSGIVPELVAAMEESNELILIGCVSETDGCVTARLQPAVDVYDVRKPVGEIARIINGLPQEMKQHWAGLQRRVLYVNLQSSKDDMVEIDVQRDALLALVDLEIEVLVRVYPPRIKHHQE